MSQIHHYSIPVRDTSGTLFKSIVSRADSPFKTLRRRADVLASIRHGEHLFKRPGPSYEIALDLFRRTK